MLIFNTSSDSGGKASLNDLFYLAFSINSISYIVTGSPFPYEKSFNSRISKKLPSFSISPKLVGIVWAEDSLKEHEYE